MQAAGELLDRARSGRGGSLFFVAEAGLGKTTVLDAVTAVPSSGMAVGPARGDSLESAVPFGLLSQAVGALGGRDVLAVGKDEAPLPDARGARFFAMLGWLEALATRSPVVLALDDLHWADPDSLALLSFLSRRIGALRVAVVGTLRPWPPEAHDVVAELAREHSAIESLAPLSRRAAAELFAARLGDALPDRVLTRAWELCAGNPLLLEQAAAAIARGDAFEGLTGERSPVTQLLITRFAGLSAPGMRAAQAASIFGASFHPQFATEIADLDEREADTALEALWRTGLLRTEADGALAFAHPLFRQALYDDLSPPARARMHARAFGLLAGRGLEAQAAEHAIRAHLVGDPEAVAVLERGGRAALRSGAFAAAAYQLGAAVDLAAERADHSSLLALGQSQLGCARPLEAIGSFERLLVLPDVPVAIRGAALRMLARALFITGDHEAAASRFEHAVALAEDEDPDGAVDALLDQALTSWLLRGPAGALSLAARAKVLARSAGEVTTRRADAVWGFIAYQCGDPDGLEATAAAARAVEADPGSHLPDLCWSWGVLATFAKLATLAERFTEAEWAFRTAFPVAERTGAAEAVAALAIGYAYTLTRQGRLGEALAMMGRAAEVADLAPMVEPWVGVGHAYVLQQLGRLDDSDTWWARAEASAVARGEWTALLYLWDLRGERHLRSGALAEACRLYTQVEEVTGRMGIREPCLVPWGRHAVAAYLAAGRVEDARRVLAWLDGADRLPCRWPAIAAHTSRAKLAEHSGDTTAAEGHYQAALALHAEVALPVEQAETLLDHGAFLRRVGQPARARPVLAEAVATAEGTGAGWLAGFARRELAVAGGRRRRSRRDPRQLTPQEERVAELAARGLANAEIAARLVVSVATVETHLSHVYAKLGVHSRRQLESALPRDR